MANNRNYNGIRTVIEINSVKDGSKWNIALPRSEGWTNIELKITLALHLRYWKYRRGDIYFERSPKGFSIGRRPDIFAMGNENLPSFWFERNDVSYDRLSEIQSKISRVRIVHVLKANDFEKRWNHIDWFEECMTREKPKREDLSEHRKSLIPQNTELWAISEDLPAGYIAFAVRRGVTADFTYLDSDEGNRIVEFRGFSTSKTKTSPLIPGLVGKEEWHRESRRTRR